MLVLSKSTRGWSWTASVPLHCINWRTIHW